MPTPQGVDATRGVEKFSAQVLNDESRPKSSTWEKPRPDRTGVEIWVASRPPSRKPQTANAQQCRHHKALMRHAAWKNSRHRCSTMRVGRSPQLGKNPGRIGQG